MGTEMEMETEMRKVGRGEEATTRPARLELCSRKSERVGVGSRLFGCSLEAGVDLVLG
jgi:hypothetical protein